MTLEELAAGTVSISITAIGGDSNLTKQMQVRLAEIGLLDPPADGKFGPVSAWALGEFLRANGEVPTHLGPSQASALLAEKALEKYPMVPGGDFPGRIVSALQARGDWICRHPKCFNIIYVDGTDPDGTLNENMHNKFQDVRLLIRVAGGGVPVLEGAWEATTEPGTYYVKQKKLHVDGAAHIVAGQYKAWSVGIHRAGSSSEHEALVQTQAVRITRDGNEDFSPDGDREFVGLFGINQHWGFDFSREDVRTASAGCLVGRTRNGHREFMAKCKSDPRYVVNNSYRFMSSVLPQSAAGTQ